MRTETKELAARVEEISQVVPILYYRALTQAATRLIELEKDRERLDWVEKLAPSSRLWIELSDALDIRKTVDDLMEKTK